MAWARTIDIPVNLAARGTATFLLTTTSTAALRVFDIVQADGFPVRIIPCQPTGNNAVPFAQVQLEAGSRIVLSAKLAGALAGDDLLFYLDDFIEEVDEDDNYAYRGVLVTNTDAVAAAFEALASSRDTLSIVVEAEIQNADNTERTSYQQLGILRRQVYAGESEPAPGTPIYPSPSALAVFVESAAAVTGPRKIHVGGGYLTLWDPTANGGLGAVMKIGGTFA